mgnify:CR=1 FL=1
MVKVSGETEIIEMDRMRKVIAKHMIDSVQTSAHVTSFVEADVTNLVMWRNKVKNAFEKRENEKITFTPIFIEAIARAIKDFPMINVSVDGTNIIVKKNINIGMAAALPSGNLIVPVIKNADRMNLFGLTKSVNDLANRARAGKLAPEEIQGGTYTLTNVGSFGGLIAYPLLVEPGALRHLAKAAAGSMRDALSLLDQAIAHGAGKVEEEQVTHMLGTVGDDHLYAVLDALAAGDVPALLAVADAMEARSLSFDAALQALATLVHRIALAQYAPEAIGDEVERARILGYVERFDAEFLQLAYQIAIHGRDELPLAPDEYTGFTMTLLRLHAFRPEQPAALGGPGVQPGPTGRAREIGVGQGTGQATGQGSFAGKPAPTVAGAGVRAAVAAQAAPAPGPSPSPPSESEPVLTPASGSASAPSASVSGSQGVRTSASAAVAAGAGLRAPAAPGQTRPEPAPARAPSPADARPAAPGRAPAPAAAVEHDVPPWEDLPAEAYADDDGRPTRSERMPAPEPEVSSRAPLVAPVPADGTVASAPAGASGDASVLLALGDWRGLIRALGLGGLVRELAQHCEWVECGDEGLHLRLSVAHRHLLDMNRGAAERIQDQLAAALGRPLKVRIEIGDIASETPAQRDAIERRARHAEAVAALEADPFVRELIERFDATLVESTVKPL